MALSSFSVKKAQQILREVIPELEKGMLHFERDDIVRPGWIRSTSPKEDGGFESIFTDVINITPEQLQLFNERSKALSNSPIQTDLGNEITRIGWF